MLGFRFSNVRVLKAVRVLKFISDVRDRVETRLDNLKAVRYHIESILLSLTENPSRFGISVRSKTP